ncbi:MAG: TolC family protein, partial [Candidatus Cloacimonadota bacterium]|nr:TolC family protein [Candidatus Cloacimonadota bacterium]
MKFKFFLIIMILMLSNFMFANNYNLDYFLKKSLEQSTNIKLSELDNEDTADSYQQSLINLFPKARVTSSHSDFLNDELFHSFGINISKSFSLYDNSIYDFLDQSTFLKNRELRHKKIMIDEIYYVVEQYINILEKQNQMEINSSNLIVSKMNFDIAKIKKQNQEIDPLDYKQIEISYLNSQISITNNELSLVNMRRTFFSEYNIVDEGFDFDDVDIKLAKQIPEYTQSIELQINKNKLKLDKKNIFREKFKLFPDVSLSYSYSFNDNSTDLFEMFDYDNYNDDHSVALNFSYSFSDFFFDGIGYDRVKRNFKRDKISIDNQIRSEKLQYEKN